MNTKNEIFQKDDDQSLSNKTMKKMIDKTIKKSVGGPLLAV